MFALARLQPSAAEVRPRFVSQLQPSECALPVSLLTRLSITPGDAVAVLWRGDEEWRAYLGTAVPLPGDPVEEEGPLGGDGPTLRNDSVLSEIWAPRTAQWAEKADGSTSTRLDHWLAARPGQAFVVSVNSIAREPCARVEVVQQEPEPPLSELAIRAAAQGLVVCAGCSLHIEVNDRMYTIHVQRLVPEQPFAVISSVTNFLWVSEQPREAVRATPSPAFPVSLRTPEKGAFKFSDFVKQGGASPRTPPLPLPLPPPTPPAHAYREWRLSAPSSHVVALQPQLIALREAILLPWLKPEAFSSVFVETPPPPLRTLLHGPHGAGKSALLRAIAAEAAEQGAWVRVFTVAAGLVEAPLVGESEARLRRTWSAAMRFATHGTRDGRDATWGGGGGEGGKAERVDRGVVGAATVEDWFCRGVPLRHRLALIVLDGLDTWCGEEGDSPWQRRVTAQIAALLDGELLLDEPNEGEGGEEEVLDDRVAAAGAGADSGPAEDPEPRAGSVCVVGTALAVDAVASRLRRSGRLDRNVRVDRPSAEGRLALLRWALAGRLRSEDGLEALADACVGYTGADILSLVQEAQQLCRRGEPDVVGGGESNWLEELESLAADITGAGPAALPEGGDRAMEMRHLWAAKERVLATALRGVSTQVPNVTWEDIGGLEDVKQRLRQAVEWPLRYRPWFQTMRLDPPRGVLLFGPPGCAKTLLVRAAARAASASFFSLSGADVYSKYVGEAERTLRDAFARAREASPAILFLDEVDALVGERHGASRDGGASAGVLATLLTEMDGVEGAEGVLVVGATNQPELLDAALLRPGRFEVRLLIPPPDLPAREQILRLHARRSPLHPDVDLAAIAARTEGYTGAELAAVCREAGMEALRESMEAPQVHARHFERALRTVRPLFGASSDGQRRLNAELDRLNRFEAGGSGRGRGIVREESPASRPNPFAPPAGHIRFGRRR